ncbi:beta strand repeat-containing protein [Haloferula helveola]
MKSIDPPPHHRRYAASSSVVLRTAAFSLITTAVGSAATVNWSSAPYVHSDASAGTMGIDQFDQSDLPFLAVNLGAGGATLTQSADPDIDFAASDPRLGLTNLGSSYGGFHANNGSANNLISRTGAYSGSVGTVTISGLSIGEDYRVQLYLMDGRGGGLAGRYVEVDGINQGVYGNGVSGSTWGDGLLVTGTFTADANQQSFTIQTFNSNSSSAGTQLNAIVVHGTALYWDGQNSGGGNGSSDNWDNATANWNPLDDFTGIATSWIGGRNAAFTGTGGAVNLTDTVLPKTLFVTSPGYSLTGATLELNDAAINNSEDFEVAATVTGTGTFSKSGAGLLTLSGDGSGFTGLLSNADGSTALASANWASAGFFVPAGTLYADPVGTITIDALEVGNGTVSIAPGSGIEIASGVLDFTTGQSGLVTGGGPLTSSLATLTVNGSTVNDGGIGTANQRIFTEITDGGGAVTLVKNNKNQLSLAAANSYTGGTTINGGRVVFSGSGAFGPGDVTINDGGQVFLTTNQSNNAIISGLGASEGAGKLGAIRFESTTWNGNVTVANPSRVVGYNNKSGAITGDLLGSADLEINIASNATANGTISLLGDGSGYTGTVTVSGGRFNTGAALGGSVVVGDPATLGAEGSIAGDLTLGTTGGATLVVDPNSPPSCNDLYLNGITTVVLSAAPPVGSPLTVVSYAGNVSDDGAPGDLTDNLDFNSTGFRMATFSDNMPGMAIELDLGTVANTWTGAGDSVWEIGGVSTNWSNGTDSLFFIGDSALFDDTASSFNVVVDDTAGSVVPNSVSFTNTAGNDYVVSGAAIAGGGMLSKTGNGELTLTNNNSYSGGTLVSDGLLRLGNNTTTGSIQGLTTVNAPGTVQYFRSNGGGVGALTGDGNLLINGNGLSGQSQYDVVGSTAGFSGKLVIDDARLRIDPPDFDDITSPIQVLDEGQAWLIAGTHNEDLEVTGLGWLEGAGRLGAIRFEINAVLAGNVTLTGDSRLVCYQGAGSGRVTGQISGGFELEKWGASGLILDPAAPNTYGSTRVTQGVLSAGDQGAFAFSPGPLKVNGGSLRLNGWDFSFASLSGTGGDVGNYFGGVASTLTVGSDNSSTSYDGTIVDGGAEVLNLVKVGTGTLVLNGANTYTGTTEVNDGALGGTGSLTSSVTVAAGAGIAPGASAGTLTIDGDLDLSAMAGGAGVLDFELDAIGASDQIVVTGDTALGTGIFGFSDFNFTDLGGLQNGVYVLVQSGTLSGTFDGADLSGPIGSATGTLQVNNNDIELLVTGAGTAYDAYEVANNIVGAGPEADSDGDGIANGIEFVVGGISDPAANSNDSDLLPTLTDNGGSVTFSFRLTDEAASFSPDMWSVEFDEDLVAPWTTAVDPGNATISVTPDGMNPWSTVEVTVAKPVAGRLFLRLSVTLP